FVRALSAVSLRRWTRCRLDRLGHALDIEGSEAVANTTTLAEIRRRPLERGCAPCSVDQVEFSNLSGKSRAMNAVATANLVGITGIARRLVLDGALDEAAAREALDKASTARTPIAAYLREHKLVTAASMAAANSAEFGMPVFDPTTM